MISHVTHLTADLEELHLFCKQGKFYEVENWIKQGRPLQIAADTKVHGKYRSALTIALDTGQHSLCLLLLRSGYLSKSERTSPFDIAIEKRRRDLVDLLFEFGTDPHRVSLWTLFDSYDTEFFERFLAAGVDLTKEAVLALFADRVARYKRPSDVIFLDQPLPRTSLGKVQKFELRKRLGL